MKPSSLRQMTVTTRLSGVGGIIMRVAVVAAVLCLSVLNLSAVSSAQAAVRQPTSIAPQGLGPALQALAKERNFQLVYRSEFVKNLHSQGASGELTLDEALTQLLSGTGLTFRYLDDRTVTVFHVSSTHDSSDPLPAMGESTQGADGRASDSGSRKGFWSRIRLAQADQTPQGTDASSASEDRPSDRSSADRIDDQVDLGEIVVVGTNIRGVYPASSPVAIYTAEDIARTGATTTEQFIAKLPQNLGTRTQNGVGAVGSASNREAVNGVDLRGLGVGTTLVLLNGRRMALASFGQASDISTIPMNAIERVEVLADGASAIYGSDAVGGVVNFVLREDFDGAETRVGYGGASGGAAQTTFDQYLGRQWSSGHGVLSYSYLDSSTLDNSDRAYSAAAGQGTLVPEDERHNLLATFEQGLGERFTVSGDFAASRRETTSGYTAPLGPVVLGNFVFNDNKAEQYFGNAAVDYQINGNLNAQVLATYASVDNTINVTNVRLSDGRVTPFSLDNDYSVLDVTAMLDGSVLALPAGDLRFSLGGGGSDEDYLSVSTNTNLGRRTEYAFGEMFIPILGERQHVPLAHRVELSLAARYTSYEDASSPGLDFDFGSKTSPKIGLLWSPSAALDLRATYGESFRAPSLTQLDPANGFSSLYFPPELGGSMLVLQTSGSGNPSLTPETAESYTLGFDFTPAALPNFRVGATYFNIDYESRVAVGDTTAGRAVLTNPNAFPEMFFTAPSAAAIESLLRSTTNFINTSGINLSDPAAAAQQLFATSNFRILDNRVRNLAFSALDGFDFSMNYGADAAWGDVSMGAQLTRILDYEQRITLSSPTMTVIDRVLFPVSLRARAFVGVSRNGFDTTVGVNYVDDYANPLGTPAGRVQSWTTVDWRLAYQTGTTNGFWSGLRFNLSIQNLFDSEPPFVSRNAVNNTAVNIPLGFDPANANPLGRFAVVEIVKEW